MGPLKGKGGPSPSSAVNVGSGVRRENFSGCHWQCQAARGPRWRPPSALTTRGDDDGCCVVLSPPARLFPDQFLGLHLGDAEIIRNGGGRVTEDVIRSLVVCQDLLRCK